MTESSTASAPTKRSSVGLRAVFLLPVVLFLGLAVALGWVSRATRRKFLPR